MNKLEFTEEAIKKYLDDCITLWRAEVRGGGSIEGRTMAVYYVDAYQSVRSSIFGETLPVPGVKTDV